MPLLRCAFSTPATRPRIRSIRRRASKKRIKPSGPNRPPHALTATLMSGTATQMPTGSPSYSAISVHSGRRNGLRSPASFWNSSWLIGTAPQFSLHASA